MRIYFLNVFAGPRSSVEAGMLKRIAVISRQSQRRACVYEILDSVWGTDGQILFELVLEVITLVKEIFRRIARVRV